VKTVYLLQRQVDPVPTTLLAQALNIKAPSVTDMIKRLSGVDDERDSRSKSKEPEGFIPLLRYTPYKGVSLTPVGEKIALEVIRHHRLIELYLTKNLGYTWDEVHTEADRLEHHISELLEARIADSLGNPQVDPHGDPIPALDGSITPLDLTLLSDLVIGQNAVVSRISDQSTEVLRYFSDLGLTPGTAVKVSTRAPLGDTVSLHIGSARAAQTISMQVARKVLVTASK
jgi:DtxR family Mn-dependent transcriptional regulator